MAWPGPPALPAARRQPRAPRRPISAATGAEPTLKEPTETREADIVIVGSGAAGCFAAYEAAKSGVGNILVVTKSGNATDSNFNEITGTASVETAALKEAGETFTVEDMYQRMINYAHWP